MWELQQRLLPRSAQFLRTGQTLVLIIDGADKLVDQHGHLISDWIPKILPRVSVRRWWMWDKDRTKVFLALMSVFFHYLLLNYGRKYTLY